MRNSLLLALALFSLPLYGGDPQNRGPEAPVYVRSVRGVSGFACALLVGVAFTGGVIAPSLFRRSSPEQNIATRGLVTDGPRFLEGNRPEIAVVESLERYVISGGKVYHESGKALPGSENTVSLHVFKNLLIKRDLENIYSVFNPKTNEWKRIADRPLKSLETSRNVLAAIDEDDLVHYWYSTDRLQFANDGIYDGDEKFEMRVHEGSTFTQLIVFENVGIMAVNPTQDADEARVLTITETGLIIQHKAKRKDLQFEEDDQGEGNQAPAGPAVRPGKLRRQAIEEGPTA